MLLIRKMPTLPFMWELRWISTETAMYMKCHYRAPWRPPTEETSLWKSLTALTNPLTTEEPNVVAFLMFSSCMERLGSYTKPQIYSYILISPYSWWVRPVFQWVFGCRGDACGEDWISIYWKIVTQHAWLNHFNYNMSRKYVLLQKMIYLEKLRLCVWALIKGSLSGSAMENKEWMSVSFCWLLGQMRLNPCHGSLKPPSRHTSFSSF